MITESSAILSCMPSSPALDDLRALVLVRLCQSRFSIGDIAEALNCSVSLVRMLVARPFRALVANEEIGPVGNVDIDSVVRSGKERELFLDLSANPDGAIDSEKEVLARLLASEIHHWLGTFEATDEERRQAVEQAGLRLDEAAQYMEDKYVFHVERVASEIRWAWKPPVFNAEGRQFHIVVGRWLAAWVHFWAADPDIWNRALDMEFANYGQIARAA